MISHHHKCIFVHIPKCAGQSIETAFLADLGLTWRTRAPLLLRSNDQPELGPARLAHLTALDYVRCKYVPEQMFRDYYTFTIVRNPWSRLVSLYNFLDHAVPYRTFVMDLLPKSLWQERYFMVRPQTEFFTGPDGGITVDDVFRFENLAEAFRTIQQKTGLKAELPVKNTSASKPSKKFDGKDWHPHWRDYYDDAMKRVIAELYASDIELLGYRFGE